MKHVLLLAYHFPPIGGAGAQRNTKLARYLPSYGFRLSVLTGPLAAQHRWTPSDASLLAEIPADVAVHRLEGPEPPWTGGWRRRAERWLRLPWRWQQWWEANAISRALEIGRDADVVYASLSPFGTANAAIAIARSLGKPLVLDLEDPWALDEMMVYETELHRRLEVRAMGAALTNADAIVMNTPEALARVRDAFPELRAHILTSILNGYDAADFVGAVAPRRDRALRIVHTGSLHSERRVRPAWRRLLGGEVAPVHVRTRSLVHLLQALERLFARQPDARTRIEVHLAGRLTAADRQLLAGHEFVHEHGFLSHAETIALIRSADLLFLPMHDVPGRRLTIVPCKTYEYLGSGRPILAAVPEGDARDLLEAAGTARIVGPADVEGMESALADALAAHELGAPPPVASATVLERIERRYLTRQVAALLSELVDRRLPASDAA